MKRHPLFARRRDEIFLHSGSGGAAFAQNPFRIGALDQNSGLSEIFSGKAGRDLYLTSLRKFGMLKKVDDAIKIELSDREGRPLALVQNFSSGGKLIFFPFSNEHFVVGSTTAYFFPSTAHGTD